MSAKVRPRDKMRKTIGRKAGRKVERNWKRFNCTVKILLHVCNALEAFHQQHSEDSASCLSLVRTILSSDSQ